MPEGDKWDAFLSGMAVMAIWVYALGRGAKYLYPAALGVAAVTVCYGAIQVTMDRLRERSRKGKE